nr:hypothetical protein [Tanacetum cinerariifolium]
MTTFAEHIIVAGAENCPSMLEKSMYDSWASRIRLFIKWKKHGRMTLNSIHNGPLVYPAVEENGQTRLKKYSELTEEQRLQDDYDVQAAKIILYSLPPDVYALQGEDLIECVNKAMVFPSTVASRNRGNATNLKGTNATSQPRVVKCYNCQGERNMARQCTQPKRPRNATWFKEKAMLAKAQKVGQILDEEKPVAQQTIPYNATFQTEI